MSHGINFTDAPRFGLITEVMPAPTGWGASSLVGR